MKKKLTLYFITLLTSVAFGQTQFSMYSGVTLSNINSKDFNGSNAIGLGVGICSSAFLSPKSDLLIEFGYEHKSFSPTSYMDYYGNDIDISTSTIKINTITISPLYNYYILTPENNSFYLTAQAGIGTTILNHWNSDNDDLKESFKSTERFKPYYSIGTSIGLENVRLTLRYNKSFGNMLSEVSVKEKSKNPSSITQERYLHASMSYFSINLTYLFNSSI